MFRRTNAGRSSFSAHISVSGIRMRARNGTMTAQYIRLVSDLAGLCAADGHGMRIDADDRAAHDASAAEGGIDRVPLLPLLRREILVERTEVQIVEGFLLRFGRFRLFFRCGSILPRHRVVRVLRLQVLRPAVPMRAVLRWPFSSISVISGCTVSSCSTSGSAFFLGICSSSCKNYFLAKNRCVPFSCRIAKMTGLVYGNVSGLMPSGSKTMIFSSCRISRSGGGSLPDTMTNCLKLGSPSEKRSRICLSTA